jgi:protein gp37
MSVKTKIQWCDSTVNPTMGCDGCELWGDQRRSCYAGTLHARFGGVTPGYAPTFEQVTLFSGRTSEAARWSDLTGKKRPDKPWLDGMPRLIFVSDMSDSLSRSVTFEFLRDEVVRVASESPGSRHQWLWLTKRTRRMATFSTWLTDQGIPWPTNLWPGTSLTNKRSTIRIPSLFQVGDTETIRFISVEPQVEPINLRPWLSGLDWVIQGGESGPASRPFDITWVGDILGQCRAAGVPLFVKQLGSSVSSSGSERSFDDSHAGDWSEWPEEIRVRQMPRVPREVTCSPP